MDVLQKAVESTVTGTGSNATATATLAAAGTGFKWRICGFCASFSGAAVATPVAATLVFNGITKTYGVSTTCPWQADAIVHPFESEENGAPALTLPAGGAGAVGAVYIDAFKVPVRLPSSYVGP